MNTFTLDELIKDVEFLVKRASKANSCNFRDYYRDSGISSNSIVAIAYEQSDIQILPADIYDLLACERMWLKLPIHRKTAKVIEVMEKARNCDFLNSGEYTQSIIQDLLKLETPAIGV